MIQGLVRVWEEHTMHRRCSMKSLNQNSTHFWYFIFMFCFFHFGPNSWHCWITFVASVSWSIWDILNILNKRSYNLNLRFWICIWRRITWGNQIGGLRIFPTDFGLKNKVGFLFCKILWYVSHGVIVLKFCFVYFLSFNFVIRARIQQSCKQCKQTIIKK